MPYMALLGTSTRSCSVALFGRRFISSFLIMWKYSRWDLLSPTRWGIVQAWRRLTCVRVSLRQTSTWARIILVTSLQIHTLGNGHHAQCPPHHFVLCFLGNISIARTWKNGISWYLHWQKYKRGSKSLWSHMKSILIADYNRVRWSAAPG